MYGLCLAIPLLPYRTLRDRFTELPLGGNILTILVVCVLIGGLLHGKSRPKSKIYAIWIAFAVYLYLSMWFGTMLGNAPAPLWLSDINFVTWKDYMLLPMLFVAATMVIKDRKDIRTVLLVTGFTVLMVDRGALGESLSHSWTNFDEDKRSGGPLGFAGSNGLAAFLAQFAMFWWGFGQFLKRKKAKLLCYALVALTLFATMYTFSRAAYVTLVAGTLLLGLLKDRKLIAVAIVFLATWQAIVPKAVTERVNMTHNANGQLEASAQERVDLWTESEELILADPVFGMGYATFQLRPHAANLRDTHNWYVKVMVETGLVGMIFALVLLQQMIAANWRLFRKATDPMYRGLGLGMVLLMSSTILLNCFGDRWTYLEISGLVWVLMGATTRAWQLTQESQTEAPAAELEMPARLAPARLAAYR